MAGREVQDSRMRQFLFQAVQCVIHAINEPGLNTPSKPTSTGWLPFGVTCPELPQVRQKMKASLGGHLPSEGSPICVETSLVTADGDSMVLETWTFRIKEKCLRDTNYSSVNHFSAVLKAICVITRQLPARQYVKVQSGESHVFCYRVYMGEPDVSRLGAGSQRLNIAQVRTVLGLLEVSVVYRTRMALSTHTPAASDQLHMVDDHFSSVKAESKRSSFPGEPSGSGESDGSTLAFSTSPRSSADTTHPGNYDTYHGKTNPLKTQYLTRPTQPIDKSQSAPENTPLAGLFTSQTTGVVPMEDSMPSDSTVPFSSLLELGESLDDIADSAHRSRESVQASGSMSDAVKSTQVSAEEEDPAKGFVFVETKAPFGRTEDRQSADLDQFYHNMRGAEPLSTSDRRVAAVDVVSDLTDRLQELEKDLPVFDEFLRSLQVEEERSSSENEQQ